jgi:hypothetical protein
MNMNKSKPNYIYILLATMLFFILVGTFFQKFIHGFYCGLWGDGVRFLAWTNQIVNNNLPLDETYLLFPQLEVYPPGIPILLSSIKLLISQNSFVVETLLLSVYAILFVLVVYLLAKKMVDEKYAIFCIFFVAFPLAVWTNGRTLYTYALTMYPRLNGTLIDYVIVILTLFFLYQIYSSSRYQKYMPLFIIVNFAHGITHISRFIGLNIPIVILSFILMNYYLLTNKTAKRSFIIFSTASIIPYLSFFTLYGRHLEEVLGSRSVVGKLPEFLVPHIFSILLVSLILMIGVIAVYAILVYKRPFTFKKRSFHILSVLESKFPLIASSIFLFIFIVISFYVTLNIHLYPQIAGPYYYGNLFTLHLMSKVATYNTIFGVLYLLLSVLGIYSLLKIKGDSIGCQIFVMLYLTSMITFLISVIMGFQPNRMNLDEYFRPFLLGAALYYIAKKETFLHIFPKIKTAIPTIKVILIAGIVLVTVSAVALELINQENVVEEFSSDGMKSSPLIMGPTPDFIISSNLISHVDSLTDKNEVVYSTYANQEIFGASTGVKPVTRREILRHRGSVEEFCKKHHVKYFVVSNSGDKHISKAELDNMVKSNPDFNLVFKNSIGSGEKIYVYRSNQIKTK